MEQALRDGLPQQLLEKVDEATWAIIRLHDFQGGDSGLALGLHVMKAIKILASPFMLTKPGFTMILAEEKETFDTILQLALWTGYLVCQEEMRGRAA
ncbi:hypothetical protein LCGC14_1214310 [marine sediment metagenome]|uniref:Uncharacterized protein n=1 Tax=marine sediment metagenome TaxID=412755 RepID=A0A0F9LD92_9ZZZZ